MHNSTFDNLSGITETSDISTLYDLLCNGNFDSDSLLIFDIDYVLIIPEDDYSMSRNEQRKKIWEEEKKQLDFEEFRHLYSIIIAEAKWKLVDDRIKDIFNYLENKEIKVMGLTSLDTGKMGIIENREDLRQRELSSVEIDFLKLKSFNEHFIIDHLSTKHGFVTMKHGIVFTAEINKALALEACLNKIGYWPKKIIFIDDMEKNLLALEKLCKDKDINFVGIHYTAVSKMPKIVSDELLEREKIKILIKEKKWLTK